MRLIKRREENGPRVDVGPMFQPRGGSVQLDPAVIEGSETAKRLPTRDYLGEEPGDLAQDPEAEAQQWAHERELYEKDEGSGSAD